MQCCCIVCLFQNLNINLSEYWKAMSEKIKDTINVLTGFVLTITSTCFLRGITYLKHVKLWVNSSFIIMDLYSRGISTVVSWNGFWELELGSHSENSIWLAKYRNRPKGKRVTQEGTGCIFGWALEMKLFPRQKWNMELNSQH